MLETTNVSPLGDDDGLTCRTVAGTCVKTVVAQSAGVDDNPNVCEPVSDALML